MVLGTTGSKVYENFTVVDSDNNLVTGIPPSAFTVDLYNPSGFEVSGSITVTITELGAGHYQSDFTPTSAGTWYLTVYHPYYFPWGKSDDILVYKSDFNLISDDLEKVLGLVHSNIYIDNPVYDGDGNLTGARIRIYSTSGSVGTNSDVIATYQITAPGDGPGRFTSWKQVET